MEPRLVIGVLGFLAASCWISAPTRAAGLPPSEDMAKARLNGSPRPAALAAVDVPGAPVRVWVVYPERKDAGAAVVYYGAAPDDLSTLATVKAPVLGLYGGSDARIDATIAATEAKMKELGKIYEPHVFEGAGHGFLRAQDAQSGANLRATEGAWPVTIAFLRQHTK